MERTLTDADLLIRRTRIRQSLISAMADMANYPDGEEFAAEYREISYNVDQLLRLNLGCPKPVHP